MQKKFESIDEYHRMFPQEIRNKLDALRTMIQQEAVHATECISYNMPAFKLKKVIAYYAAYSHHIGFYPMPAAIEKFSEELKSYKTSKGAIQFPLHLDLPEKLIRKIIQYNLKHMV